MRKKLICIIAILSIMLVACNNDEAPPSSSDDIISATTSEVITSEVTTSEVTTSEPSSVEVTSMPTSVEEVTSAPPPPPPPKPKPKPAPPPPSSTPTSAPPVTSEDVELLNGIQDHIDAENAIFMLVNELRASLQLPPYKESNMLKNSAFIRSKEMAIANELTHTRPNGLGFQTAIDQTGYVYSTAMENIGTITGYSSDEYAKVLFNLWKNSEGHYSAMINTTCEEIGISLYYLDGNVYATQHFGKRQ